MKNILRMWYADTLKQLTKEKDDINGKTETQRTCIYAWNIF